MDAVTITPPVNLWTQIVCMLKDVAHDRYHPIMFVERPLGSADLGNDSQRYKSHAHHTVGFESESDAWDSARELANQTGSILCEMTLAWDGEGVPAMVSFFRVCDGKAEFLF